MLANWGGIEKIASGDKPDTEGKNSKGRKQGHGSETQVEGMRSGPNQPGRPSEKKKKK